LTKQEFIDKVADEAGLSRRDAQKAVDAVLETIQSTLRQGGEINFTGFAILRRVGSGRRERVDLYYADGSLVTLNEVEGTRLLELAREALRAARA